MGSTAGSFQHGSQPQQTEEGITRFSLAEGRQRPKGRTDWEKLKSLSDEDIARAVADDPDAAPLDLDWSQAKVYFPKGKMPVSLRIDPDVLAFFKSTGKGFQTRMNAVLRAYMEHELSTRVKK